MQSFQDIEHFVKTLSAAIKKKIPTKVSQLTNDAGYKTTDTNTTYKLSKSGSTVTLTGSDGSTTSVADSNTTYSSLKNPYSLDIQNNGTTVASYDGSTAKTANFTNATASANGLMSAADKSKLDGIGAGSNVESVNGKTGVVSLSKADVGLGNVDNTRDADKHVLANNIQWGGNNIVGSIDPISAAMSDLHSANRLAFCNPKGITAEYSTDGGTTWLDSGVTDAGKTALVSGIGNLIWFGNVSSGTPSTDDQLRITIDAVDCQIYCQVKTILIEYNTSNCIGSSCKIEIAYNRDVSVFSDIGTYNVGGWSGWNSIPVDLRFGTQNQASNVRKVRLTFSFKSLGPYAAGAPNVRQIKFYGTTAWWTHSSMGTNGHLYSYDAYQNATFPAKVTATSFSGATATSSADGLMSKADKAKLDGIASGADAVTIKTVKVNGTALTPDSSKAVNVTVPTLANNATTTESGMALDARMGKTLSDQISSVKTGAIDQIVNLTATGWTGDAAPYSQTVNVTGMTEDLLCELFSACPKSATVAEREAYNEAFALVASGYAETADGSATFLVDEKPAIDIWVRIYSLNRRTTK